MFVFVFPLFYSAAVSAEAAATHLRLSIATRLRAPPTNTPPSPPSCSSPPLSLSLSEEDRSAAATA